MVAQCPSLIPAYGHLQISCTYITMNFDEIFSMAAIESNNHLQIALNSRFRIIFDISSGKIIIPNNSVSQKSSHMCCGYFWISYSLGDEQITIETPRVCLQGGVFTSVVISCYY
jgi:hypothetical protein